MSRTIRLRKGFVPWWNDYSHDVWEDVAPEDINETDQIKIVSFRGLDRIWYRRKITDKRILKKIWWKSHKDDKFNFKEPGPHWYRNLTSDRPLRRRAKNEIQKFMRDPNYDVVIDSKGKLDYWT